MTPRVRIRTTPAASRVRAVLAADVHLRAAQEQVRRRTGLPAERVREFWAEAVFDKIDIVGDGYVGDLETARTAVERIGQRLAEIRELAFTEQLTQANSGEMAGLGEALREDLLAVADPRRWAREHPRGAAKRGDAPVPVRTPAERERLRRGSRLLALTEERRKAFELARTLAPDRLEAVLRGEPKAAVALRRELAKGMNDWAVDRVFEAVDHLRDPGLDYALGAGLSGPRTGPTAVSAALRDLPAAQRDVVNQAIIADPDVVRAAVTAETAGGVAVHGELDRLCAEHGITGERRAALEEGLRALNDAHRESQRTIGHGETGSPQARARARILDRAAAELGLPARDEIARGLARSSTVVEIASRSPEHLEQLVNNWLRYAVEKRREGKQVATLERYVRALSRRHVRGVVGELTAAFQLADDAWVIKVPGLDVTLGGTDFVLVRTNGELWYGDNKALASLGLGKVSSLVENIADNMAADDVEFGRWLHREDTPVPPVVRDAIQRAGEAAVTVRGITQGLSDKAIRSDRVQRRVTRILDGKGVRRIVTNAAGDLSWLTGSVRNHLDFIDLRTPGPHEPIRPVEPPGGAAGPTALGGGEGSEP